MEETTNLIWLALAHSGQIFELAFAIIAAASAVAAITPTPADDHFFAKAYRIVDLLALNFGHAKEKPNAVKGGRFVAE